MKNDIFDERDLQDVSARGIAPDEVQRQIEIFRKGFSYVDLQRPCRLGDGIRALNEKDFTRLTSLYSKAQEGGRAMKFVPASGAATRMFKELLSVNGLTNDDTSDLSGPAKKNDEYRHLLNFLENIKRFPFYDELNTCMSRDGIDIDRAVSEARYKEILEYTLSKRGLNLAGLPKALISFHQYPDGPRTPVEEHLAEATAYTADGQGKARIHFTVSMEHEEAIKEHIKDVKARYRDTGVHFEITFSNQRPSTDTIAVHRDNSLFREPDGSLIFRPGGHGALLENLNALDGDIVFIKNIDNVAPDRIKDTSSRYKKALAGYLVELEERIFDYLKRLEAEKGDEGLIEDIFNFISGEISMSAPASIEDMPCDKKAGYLFNILNRPIRVCGMVRNQAEPGGGPFWVRHPDGGISLQIVEKSQINTEDEKQRRIMEESTHFNPVDLVCGVKDYRGRPFDLKRYVDPDTYFISIKSKDGVELKALELPGLWNGAMAYWNTVFIEVPLITFNPVKTIFDLLRDEHQPGVL